MTKYYKLGVIIYKIKGNEVFTMFDDNKWYVSAWNRETLSPYLIYAKQISELECNKLIMLGELVK